MRIFIVLASVPYEGSDIIGVYGNEQQAKDIAEVLQQKEDYVTYEVEEWEVQ